MKTVLLLIFCLMIGGCAMNEQARVDREPVQPVQKPVYTPNPAGALVFEPPVTYFSPKIDLSRENRSPAAFYGYEQSTVDSYYLYQRDEQRYGAGPSRFERDARFSRSSITYR